MKNKSFQASTLFLVFFLLMSSCAPDAPKSLSASLTSAKASNGPDYQAVESAILDYVEGIYEVDSTRIERSVHPQLRKRGYWYNAKEAAYRDNLDMTYDQLVHLAASWNKSGKRAGDSSPKKIEIYDVNDRTASAKLTAEWGIDYFHLAKLDDKWMIMNVLWQSIPEMN